MPKYKNRKVENEDGVFDSTLEYKRYQFLCKAQERGEIRALTRQVEYELIPKQTREKITHLKTKDKVEVVPVERACIYRADFRYEAFRQDSLDGMWVEVVEDVKGRGKFFSTQTKDFVIKRKLMLFKFGIILKIVTKADQAI